MKTIESTDIKGAAAWKSFIAKEQLTQEQAAQFRRYIELLLAWNEDINLTRIQSIATVISHHLQDSLALAQAVTLGPDDMICDIGSGGGFPGIPLKIRYPHIKVVLIEVSYKKIRFLQEVIKELALTDIEVCSLDWRTFLRKTNYPVTYFCARASLRPDELVRVFSPHFGYDASTLVYWGSKEWQMGPKETPFFLKEKEYEYGIDAKKRRLLFFAKKSS